MTTPPPSDRSLLIVLGSATPPGRLQRAVDGDGVPRTVNRPYAVPGPVLEQALASARAALRGSPEPPLRDDAAGVTIGDGAGGLRGALGIAGGPEGFALEACRVAARALGISTRDVRPLEDLTA